MMNEGKRVSPSSFRICSSSFLKREARAYHAALAGNFAAVLAYDARRKGQAQARAARETSEGVAVRVGHVHAAPFDYDRLARLAGTFPRESDFRAAFFARLRGRPPARCDIL